MWLRGFVPDNEIALNYDGMTRMNNAFPVVVATILTLGILAMVGGILRFFTASTNDAMIVAGAILLAGGSISVSLRQPPPS